MHTEQQSGSSASNIPEHLEMDVMNFILKNTVYAVKENVYVIDDVSALASALIKKYKITI